MAPYLVAEIFALYEGRDLHLHVLLQMLSVSKIPNNPNLRIKQILEDPIYHTD